MVAEYQALPSPAGRLRLVFAFFATGVVASSLAFSARFTSFLHAKELVLTVALLLMLAAGFRQPVAWRTVLRPLAPLIVVYLLQVAVSIAFPPRVFMLWSSAMLSFGLVLATLLAAGTFVASARWHLPVLGVLAFSTTSVALMGLLQYAGLTDALLPPTPGYTQRMYSVFGNQDLFGGYVALGITLVAALMVSGPTRWRVWNIAALFVLFPALAASGSRSAWLAVAAGLLFVLPWRRARCYRWAPWLLLSGGLGFLCFGGVVWSRLMLSFGEGDVGWRVRLWLWDGTLRMIRDAPLLGVGPGNFAYWSPRYLGEALLGPHGTHHYHNTIHTLHAHSDPLEWVAETGAAGLLALLIMLWYLRHARGPAVGGLVALLAFACFNPALQSAPHLLAAGLLTLLALRPHGEVLPARPGGMLLPILATTMIVLHGGMVLLPSFLQARAEDAHLAGAAPELAYGAGLRRISSDAERGYAIALMEKGRYEAARSALMRARLGLDTGELYWCLAQCALAINRPAEARLWANRCGARWPREEAYLELERTLVQYGR